MLPKLAIFGAPTAAAEKRGFLASWEGELRG